MSLFLIFVTLLIAYTHFVSADTPGDFRANFTLNISTKVLQSKENAELAADNPLPPERPLSPSDPTYQN
jgi:hypothetical protein